MGIEDDIQSNIDSIRNNACRIGELNVKIEIHKRLLWMYVVSCIATLASIPMSLASGVEGWEFVPEEWIDLRLADVGYGRWPDALPLGPNKKLVDEGVCIRSDGLTPTILKAKSPIFLGHETALLDKGVENLEDVGSTIEENA